MTLQDKLSFISKPSIPRMSSGETETIRDFWTEFIEPKLISKEIISQWCNLLYRYIDDSNVVYAIRKFGDRGRNGDYDLRRGFYTLTNKDYSFFYTDNYFSAYFFKMAFDGFVPNYEEFKNLLISRKFPARFGQSCRTERERAAFDICAKDPGINSAGYKISHIIDVGTGYWNGHYSSSISDICDRYFPRGDYSDWILRKDEYGPFYAREISVLQESKEYIKAIFLRMACPLNYILTPKKNLHTTQVYVSKNDIGESEYLQSYARQVFMEKYGALYNTFLNRIMINFSNKNLKDAEHYKIGLRYGFEFADKKTIVQRKETKEYTNSNLIKTSASTSEDLEMQLALEYLINPNTSFRKLERGIMHIDSPARGGGFKAKTIINNLGITADKKGVLVFKDAKEEIQSATGLYKETLLKIIAWLKEQK